MKNTTFIVLDKQEAYTYVTVIAILVIGVMAFLFNEGMKAGEEANRLYKELEVQEQKSQYWHDGYLSLTKSGTCLERIPELDKQLAFESI